MNRWCREFFFKKYIFIYFEKKEERRGGAEGERERVPSRLCPVSVEPHTGLNLTTMRS